MDEQEQPTEQSNVDIQLPQIDPIEQRKAEKRVENKYGFIADTIILYLLFLLGLGLGWLVAYLLIKNNYGATQWWKIWVCVFFPCGYRAFTKLITTSGCLYFILKLVICWFIGPVLYLFYLLKAGHYLRKSFKKTIWGILVELLYLATNLILVALGLQLLMFVVGKTISI